MPGQDPLIRSTSRQFCSFTGISSKPSTVPFYSQDLPSPPGPPSLCLPPAHPHTASCPHGYAAVQTRSQECKCRPR